MLEYPLPLRGQCLDELVLLLLSSGDWQKKSGLLFRSGQVIFDTNSSHNAFLPLLPSAEKSELMLRWFWSQEFCIRPAKESDLDIICTLKERIIRHSFPFFSDSEMQLALERSASREYMAREISQHDFWVGEDGGDLTAVAGIKKEDQKTAFLYSAYSEGRKGGVAIASFLIYRAMEQGFSKVASNVYEENSCGAHLLQQFGFKKEGELKESTYVPGYQINRWALSLS